MQIPTEQKDNTNDYIQLAQIEAQEKYKEKTAKDVWEKYKDQFKSGVYSEAPITTKDKKTGEDVSLNIKPALMALKSLQSDEWKKFITLALENTNPNEKLTTDAKNQLIKEMVYLEPLHTPATYLLRSNTIARLLFMYDNPKIDETNQKKFLSFDPTGIVGSSKLITDRHLQLLIERGVDEKDIASVAFFNTIGSSYGTFITKEAAALRSNPAKQMALLTITNIFKGDARITETPEEIIRKKIDAMINGHPDEPKGKKSGIKNDKTLSSTQKKEKIKELEKLRDDSINFIKAFRSNITKEQDEIVKRYKQLTTPTQTVQVSNTPPREDAKDTTTPTINMPPLPPIPKREDLKDTTTNIQSNITAIKHTQHEINLKLYEPIEAKLHKLFKELADTQSPLKNSDYQKNMHSLMDNISTLQLKIRLDEQKGSITLPERKEIDNKIKEFKEMLNLAAKMYTPPKEEVKESNKFTKFVSKAVSDLSSKASAAKQEIQKLTAKKETPPKTNIEKPKIEKPEQPSSSENRKISIGRRGF